MLLIVDEEVQGHREVLHSVDDLKGRIIELIDESVEMVTIKKRAAKNNSQNCRIKGLT